MIGFRISLSPRLLSPLSRRPYWGDNTALARQCVQANENVLRVMGGWNMCVNLQWQLCAAKGLLHGQGTAAQMRFSIAPSALDVRLFDNPPKGCVNNNCGGGYAVSDVYCALTDSTPCRWESGPALCLCAHHCLLPRRKTVRSAIRPDDTSTPPSRALFAVRLSRSRRCRSVRDEPRLSEPRGPLGAARRRALCVRPRRGRCARAARSAHGRVSPATLQAARSFLVQVCACSSPSAHSALVRKLEAQERPRPRVTRARLQCSCKVLV